MPKDMAPPDPHEARSSEPPDPAEALRVAAFFTYLIRDCGYKEPKVLPGGRYACLMPLLFTTAIVTGPIGDRIGYDDRWCFHDAERARRALEEWNGSGEPEGWHRHPNTGRRRRIEDDLTVHEWVDP